MRVGDRPAVDGGVPVVGAGSGADGAFGSAGAAATASATIDSVINLFITSFSRRVRVSGGPHVRLFRCDHEMRAPVLRPGGLSVTRVERKFLAVADRPEPVGRDTQRDEIGLDRDGAEFAEREVVLRGAAFVTVSLDGNDPRRIFLHYVAVGRHDRTAGIVQVRSVESEVRWPEQG